MNKPSRGFNIIILTIWMALVIIAGVKGDVTLAEELTIMILITIGFIVNDLKPPPN